MELEGCTSAADCNGVQIIDAKEVILYVRNDSWSVVQLYIESKQDNV